MTHKNQDRDILKQFGGLSKNNLREIFMNNEDLERTIDIVSHSPYISTEDIGSYLKDYSSDFSVLTLNIQSINAKIDQLRIFIDFLASNNFAFSAICIQETWISGPNPNFECLQIPHYQCITLGSVCSSHSGLAIYVHSQFSVNKRNLYTGSRLWEGLFVDINHHSLNKKITLCNIYRAPRDTNAELSQFINDIRPVIEQLSNESSSILFAGDININLLQTPLRDKYNNYLDLLINNGLIPYISLPTRFSRRSATLIDHIFGKLNNPGQKTLSGIVLSEISDHLPCFIILKNKHCHTAPPKYVQVRTNTESAYANLQSELRSLDLNPKIDTSDHADPNRNYNIICQSISQLCSKHLPIRKVKFQKYRHKVTPWITFGIMKSIKYRDKLYRSLKLLHPDTTEYSNQKLNLKTYNTILRKSIREAKRNYYYTTFKKYRNDIRKTWSTIKTILNANKSKSTFPQFFKVKDARISNYEEISENFNNFFVEIGPLLARKLDSTNLPPFHMYLTQNITSNFQFANANLDEIKLIIKNFEAKTSVGHDGISMKIVKLLDNKILTPLTLTINQSLTTGIFPDELKIAKVLPIYKKDDNALFDNYRPISILPAISKIFERIVFNQLYNYFVLNKLLYYSQHGFRKLHSTETATLEFTDKIIQHLDSGNLPVAIFIDLSKAFDTIDHQILLNKLHYYGIRGTALHWFKSYLSNRTQYVQFEDVSSSKMFLSTGVPQGSILGPLLFIIYVNDICFASNKFKYILYADDTSIESPLCNFTFSSSSTGDMLSESINTELSLINNWFIVNKLSLNSTKTKFMIFHYPQFSIDNIPCLLLLAYRVYSRFPGCSRLFCGGTSLWSNLARM